MKGVRKLRLRDAGLSSRPDFTNELPIQLCESAWRLVQHLARVQQPLLFGFGDAALAPALVFGDDSDAATMERRRGKQVATHCEIADVTQSSEIAVRRRNGAIRVLIWTASTHEDWKNRIVVIPFH